MRIPLDVTTAGAPPDGEYIGTVEKVEYQAKTGDKWNNEGTQNCSSMEELQAASGGDLEKQRAHVTVKLRNMEGKKFGNQFHDLYLMESARGFIKQFLQACKVPFDKEGFDLDECVGKEVGVKVTLSEDPQYGTQVGLNFFKL